LAESPSKEVEIMKKFLMALMVLAIASAPALAGPNANGIIMVHNTGMAWTSDPLPPTPVPACADVVNSIPMGNQPGDVSANLIWKVYAAFPVDASPRVKTCGWGISYPAVGGGGVIIEHNDAQNLSVFYITSAGWPASGTEVGMSFTDSARVDIVNELWWSSGYSYAGLAGEPQTFCIVPNSAQGNQVFGDDSFPTNEDPITGYGCLGFGTDGYTPCPVGEPTGACCFAATGECVMLLVSECAAAGGSFVGGECLPNNPCPPPPVYGACCVNYVCNVVTPQQCTNAGGTYYGDGTVCLPETCPPPTPTESKSWGQIKNNYR